MTTDCLDYWRNSCSTKLLQASASAPGLTSEWAMVLPSLMVAAILAGDPQQAAQPDLSTQRVDKPAPDGAKPIDKGDLPVSLDRIREALKRAPDQSVLRDLPPDFRVHIQIVTCTTRTKSRNSFRYPGLH